MPRPLPTPPARAQPTASRRASSWTPSLIVSSTSTQGESGPDVYRVPPGGRPRPASRGQRTRRQVSGRSPRACPTGPSPPPPLVTKPHRRRPHPDLPRAPPARVGRQHRASSPSSPSSAPDQTVQRGALQRPGKDGPSSQRAYHRADKILGRARPEPERLTTEVLSIHHAPVRHHPGRHDDQRRLFNGPEHEADQHIRWSASGGAPAGIEPATPSLRWIGPERRAIAPSRRSCGTVVPQFGPSRRARNAPQTRIGHTGACRTLMTVMTKQDGPHVPTTMTMTPAA